jgi:amino acid transporter
MSNKSQYIKPSLDYRKAKTDWVRALVGFLVITGITFIVYAAALVMAVPEQ